VAMGPAGLAVQFAVALGQFAGGHAVQGGDFRCDVMHQAAPFIEGFPRRGTLKGGSRSHTEPRFRRNIKAILGRFRNCLTGA